MPRLTLALVAAATFAGCASLGVPTPSTPSFAGEPAQPGTSSWWKKHKKKAEFVPGEGFRVAGFDGYFDQEGRPIHAKVAKKIKPKQGGLLADVKFSSAVQGIKTQVGMGPDEQLARASYSEGEQCFREERYNDAIKKFKHTSARSPSVQLKQDAMFQLAESYFFAENYPKANDAYEAIVQEYPNSPHLDKVIRRQFDLARYWESHHNYDPHWAVTPNLLDKRRPLFDTLGRAIKNYENIRLNDPTGPLADDAVMATANSYFIRGRYVDADYHYDLLRKEFPRSEHQYEAHLLGLECKLRRYEGSDYDGTSLQEGKKLAKQLRRQFGVELDAEQRQRIREREGRLEQLLATRDIDQAVYHEGKKEYGSAKFYYSLVAKNYPQTEAGKHAVERIAALEGKPDVPVEPLHAIVKLLPQSAARSSIAQIPLLETGPSLEGNSRQQMATRTDEGQGNASPIRR
ncbi:outer membrane protein assembly factor BamD [Adhaeretor mobilis]|uniref:Outer membrane protein assembly factor BamD n=1 Tax=Adhaeretor mobilis TaxID=1930276 RepID=A0A517MSJ7_9BACT|nr:outer membrane protein assembly factor BamD [Adhaeretor mobilis]QDS97854.1 Outer membrane protein assembly factor BamD [Adhaeretor mobilis]